MYLYMLYFRWKAVVHGYVFVYEIQHTYIYVRMNMYMQTYTLQTPDGVSVWQRVVHEHVGKVRIECYKVRLCVA